MGEYAELSIDRELDNFLSCKNEDGNPYIKSNFRCCSLWDYDVIRNSGEIGILFRNYKLSFNIIVLLVRETNYAFLFMINDEYHKQNGKSFWCPKSILNMKENEKQVFYVPNWAKLTIVK